jgi:hypothetical protein
MASRISQLPRTSATDSSLPEKATISSRISRPWVTVKLKPISRKLKFSAFLILDLPPAAEGRRA